MKTLRLFALPLYFSLAAAASAQVDSSIWRQEFTAIPEKWKVETKPGVPSAIFEIVDCKESSSGKCLNMRSDKASASLVGHPKGLDLTKTPIIRFRWRVSEFPAGADGNDSDKDDQAIGIYISIGGFLSQKSLAYRWETETPVNAEGNCKYAGGIVKVKWICLRNKKDGDGKTFLTEERNVAEDFKKAFGEIPTEVGIGISCNSQYTGTKAAAQLDWIELRAAPASGGK